MDWFAEVYRQAEAKRRTLPQYLSRLPLNERAAFPSFYTAYLKALKEAELRLDSERLSFR
jgi:hypothetical protein